MRTEAQIRAQRKYDAKRERVALWMSSNEAAMLERYRRAWNLADRPSTLRKLFFVSRRCLATNAQEKRQR